MNLDKQNLWRRISQSEIRNSAAESEGGQKFLPPPTPFLFARPSVQFGARLPAEASAQAGSAPSVPFKKGSDFVKQTHQKITSHGGDFLVGGIGFEPMTPAM